MRKLLILGVLVVVSIVSAPAVFSQGNPEEQTGGAALELSKASKPVYDMDSIGDKTTNSLDAYGDKQTNNLDRYGDKQVYSLGMRTPPRPVYDTSSLSGEIAAFDVTQRRGIPASINYTRGLFKPLYNASDYYRFKPIYDVSSYFRAKPLYNIGA